MRKTAAAVILLSHLVAIPELEQRITTLVNAERQARDIKPLTDNLYSRVTITGNHQKLYDWNSPEQIAGSTVNGWMHSSGHRQNILQPSYLKTGLGAAIARDGKVYITQVFCG
jgi:uncharacterized protein YkwD